MNIQELVTDKKPPVTHSLSLLLPSSPLSFSPYKGKAYVKDPEETIFKISREILSEVNPGKSFIFKF